LQSTGLLEEEVPLHSKSKAITEWREAQDTDEGREKAKNNLRKFSTGVFPLFAPVESIRDIYGEEIAMYFEWMNHLNFWLFIPSLLAVVVFVCH